MKNKKYLLTIIILGILLSLTVLCSTTAAKKTAAPAPAPAPVETPAVNDPAGYFKDAGNLNKITDIINIIQQWFVVFMFSCMQEL